MFVLGSNAAGGYNLTDSVRFRSASETYLTRTPSSTSNRRTYTISVWVKRGALSAGQQIIQQRENVNSSQQFGFQFLSGDTLRVLHQPGTGGSDIILETTAVYRDPSAWYHIVVAMDTTQATASNRTKLYVNGEQITSFASTTYPTQNLDTAYNENTRILIGCARPNNTTTAGVDLNSFFDGYMTEFNSVDGQALTPSDFGETDSITGVWKPKEYTGSYGTNGFYLPMKATTQAEGFNTVTYTGTGTSGTKISNVGFQPDLVWVKNRDQLDWHHLFDSVRGVAGGRLSSNDTAVEYSDAQQLQSFDVDGYTYGTSHSGNASGEDYVAWCWEAGGTASSNTDGTITSSVSANTAKGFSIVTYTGNGTNPSTIGHGLGAVPKFIISKARTGAPLSTTEQEWNCYSAELGNDKKIILNNTNAVASSSNWGSTTPTSSVYTVGANGTNGSGSNFVAYCFAEVAGFSKFGSYTGTGSAGNSITGLGFRPAWIMYKRTDTTSNWTIHDITRDPSNEGTKRLYPNLSNAEQTVTGDITFDSDGFTLDGTGGDSNAAGGTYIYMAFADTRDNQWNFDASGNKNNWTPVNINSNASSETTYDIMSDVPTLTDEDTSNFATWNPLSETSSLSTSEANLAVNNTVLETQHRLIRATMGMSTGKYYWEVNVNNSAYVDMVGIINSSYNGTDNQTVNVSNGFGYGYSTTNGNWYVGGGWTSDGVTPSAFPSSGIIGVAFDADNKKLYFSRNNTWINSANPSAGTGANATYTGSETEFLPALSIYYNTGTWRFNFGQRPFAYTPPTGYKKLNTYNLPDSSIVDGSDYFDVDTWSGDSSATTQIATPFSPDFVWIKNRSNTGGSGAASHMLYDTVRGVQKELQSNLTDAEGTLSSGLNSFDSNGYKPGTSTRTNETGNTYVGWAWRGSDSTAVSNTDGDITSTVSANTTSGFSIVSWVADNSASTRIGHGLGTTPKVAIIKNRDTVGNWNVYTTIIDGSYDFLYLNLTNAKTDSGLSTFTSTTIAAGGTSTNTDNMIAYCFAEVEGFSKFGTYIGNASTDGPFVYTGFRPAWILEKNATNGSYGWLMWDSTRSTYNMVTKYLVANTSGAEVDSGGAGGPNIDILSNGFKIRDANPGWNQSGATLFYMAFAENPFKNSLAR